MLKAPLTEVFHEISVMCQALAIRPTTILFLYFFRTRPIPKRVWVSLSSESWNAILGLYAQSFKGFKNQFFRVAITKLGHPFFFNEDDNPRFPLYWTQVPLKVASWSKDKMIDAKLEVLSVLVALPRPFSSRKVINCLEHDDVNSRVFGMFFY